MRRPRAFLASMAGAAALVAAFVVAPLAAAPAQAATLPLQGEAQAFLNATFVWNYSAAPAGANVRCVPSAAHPYPVILTEGTFSSMYNSFGAISPDLANNGYCGYAFNYGQTVPFTGIYATGDIATSAAQLATEVSRVLSETGAGKVDIVGWSQGGMMPRYYINELGGAAKVNMLVGLAPSNYGTTLDGLVTDISELGAPTPCRTWSTRSGRIARPSSRCALRSVRSSATCEAGEARHMAR
jgi:triacylglycerol esterase/lipase EstA (alpha/beta hydrolase family)